jgi:mannitol-specific phosphotransferase system IIBC component
LQQQKRIKGHTGTFVARAPTIGDAAITDATAMFLIPVIFFSIGVYRIVTADAAATVIRSQGFEMKHAMMRTRI